MSRPLLLLLLGALFATLAVLIDEPDPETRLSAAAARLEHRIEAAQNELNALVEEQARLVSSLGPGAWMDRQAELLEKERERTGTLIHVEVDDSLMAWSGDLNGYGEPGQGVRLLASVRIGSMMVKAGRPVWSAPRVQNRYLREGFHPSLGAAEGLMAVPFARPGVDIGAGATTAPLRVAWRDGAMELGAWLWWRAALIACASVLLIAALWKACGLLLNRRRLLAVAVFIAGLVLLRWLSLAFGHSAPFDRWPLFDPAVYATGWWFPSLGDLVINSALLGLGSLFALHAARPIGFNPNRVTTFIVLSIPLFQAAAVTWLTIGLVGSSTIDLDLYHIQGLGAFGAVALLVVALLMAGWCLTALAATRLLAPGTVRRLAGPALLAAGASILVHHLSGVRDTVLFLWPLAGMAIFLVGRALAFGFLQGVLLLTVLAGTSTHIIAKHMGERERNERSVLAERLAMREDPVLEQLFRDSAPAIRRDLNLYRLFSSGEYCDPNDLEKLVKQPHLSGYWERYDLRLFGYDPQGELRCATDLDAPLGFTVDSAAFPAGISDMPDLFVDERIGGELYYHARIAIMPHDSAPPAQLVLELKPRSLSQGAGFPDLLLAGTDELARRTERYSQARYVNGLLMDRRGPVSHPQRWSRALDDELWYVESGQDFLAKAVGGNVVMVLGLPHRTFLDRITTFSYLFTLFGLLMLIALGAHAALTGTLPDLGIGTKVRAALVLFAITGLMFFGIGSQRLLTRQFEEREANASLDKARAVSEELRRRIGDERIDSDAYAGYLNYLLSQLGNAYFTDLTLYAPDGRWLASTRPQMLSQGLLGPRMDHSAYARLAIRQQSAFVHQERVGTAGFRTAYLPVLDSKGKGQAFLALPSFADQAQQSEERAQLLVAVVNLFVLLFALSVLLAVFISNWTTRPLDVLKRALARVALRGSNQPIHYRGNDEVGELVAVYNQKVEELRESAERLARSERESAWREMARQVAHEVKNPLTPMKLGIQHFQYTFDPKAPDAKERVDRFAKSMVEQIDTLNGVASAFSQFAQMPAASPTELDLCEVVRAAVDVFHASPGIAITHQEEGPLPVLADREHMLRVLNNLLKNAVQAMPEDHDGRIDVIARREVSRARIEVRDNGAGIPTEARDRIFTPSFTTKSSGMGLGLAMVKRMVEQAGGRVWFESDEGQGTRFFVELPLHR
ncbi:MAG: HAMP domain-containing histidine kinase [Flavobacteriales bacterium]|nr:HAMP domain-containing histidine kinase [Flavobacteriales bacterium]